MPKRLLPATLIFLLQPMPLWAEETAATGDDKKNYYVESPSYSTQRESDPPRYVRTLSDTGMDAFKNLDWLDAGLVHRMRYEHRDNDYRRPAESVDDPFLFRTRAYLGVKNIADPLRLTVEFTDSERTHSQFARDDRDVNQAEFIQAYGELYFKDALGDDRPLSIRAGRMAFETLDRRLIARNEWRNTTNSFQGVRALLGQDSNDWELELFALQPMRRLLYSVDRRNEDVWFTGAIGHWRQYSDTITLEPFYFRLDQGDDNGLPERTIHSPGLRAYGYFGKSGFDYDASLIYQFGESDGDDVEALGAVAEIGYRFDMPWKPRLSMKYGYGSGDEDPTDDESNRFERFYGFGRPWSANDYFQWENISTPKARLELQPARDTKFDAGYSLYWLASDTDRWNNANLRDSSGQSGDFIGQEFDMRLRQKLMPHVEATTGYAYFEPGEFTENTSRNEPSHFFYLELTFSLFD